MTIRIEDCDGTIGTGLTGVPGSLTASEVPITPTVPRVFSLVRYDDVSGISGTGIVAQGVQFRDGQVVLQWCCPGLPSSVAVWASLEDVLTIHGHRGSTVVKWADGRD